MPVTLYTPCAAFIAVLCRRRIGRYLQAFSSAVLRPAGAPKTAGQFKLPRGLIDTVSIANQWIAFPSQIRGFFTKAVSSARSPM